jgi:hypothetical protein
MHTQQGYRYGRAIALEILLKDVLNSWDFFLKHGRCVWAPQHIDNSSQDGSKGGDIILFQSHKNGDFIPILIIDVTIMGVNKAICLKTQTYPMKNEVLQVPVFILAVGDFFFRDSMRFIDYLEQYFRHSVLSGNYDETAPLSNSPPGFQSAFHRWLNEFFAKHMDIQRLFN